MATKDDKALDLAEDNEKRIEKLEKRIKDLENQIFAVTKKTEKNHSDLLLVDSSVGDVSARMKAGFAAQDQKRAQELAARDKSIQGLQWKTADIDKRLVKGLAQAEAEDKRLSQQLMAEMNRMEAHDKKQRTAIRERISEQAKHTAQERQEIVDWVKRLHKLTEKTEKDTQKMKKFQDGLNKKIDWVMRLVK